MKKTLALFAILFAFALCAADAPTAKVTFKNGVPSLMTGLDITVGTGEAAVRGYLTRDFLPRHLAGIAVQPRFERHVAAGGTDIYRYTYTYKGIAVEGARTTVAVRNGRIYRVANALSPFSVDTAALVPAADAARIAFSLREGVLPTAAPKHWAEKIIVRYENAWRLAWKVRLVPTSLADGRFAYIDARDGSFLGGGNDTRHAEPTDIAKVFETNPVRNKSAVEVTLPWIDPADGKLTAVEDDNGVRAIVAANCPDEGKITVVQGYGELAICSPKQIADKNANGDFVYEDWQAAVDFEFSVEDVYPEVSMYYHASKIYKYLRELEVEGFEYLKGHNADSANPTPLIVVANFQFPSQSGGLSPMDNAFFSPNQPGFNEIFFADFPYQGDILVFGQGSGTDFACDGDVIYHEFGHAVENGTSQLSPMAFADEYGFSNIPIGMNEGIADTFSFIMSQDPCLGEYASEGLASMAGYERGEEGFYCMRDADNDNLVNEDYTGESHHDGLPLVGANWDIFQLALDKGLTRDDFSRLLLKTLVALADPEADAKDYAETMLSEAAADDAFAAFVEDIRKIFEDKLFYEEVRARDLSRPVDYIFSGGTDDSYGMPKTYFTADLDGDEMDIAPAYVQFYYDMPECMDTLTVTGTGYAMSQSGGSDPYYWLLVRKGKPVTYDIENYPVPVAMDDMIEPVNDEYVVKKLEPGSRYYLHFVNLGGEGLVVYPTATPSRTGAEPCGETPDDILPTDDEPAADEETDADTVVVPDTTAKKSAGGCALTTL